LYFYLKQLNKKKKQKIFYFYKTKEREEEVEEGGTDTFVLIGSQRSNQLSIYLYIYIAKIQSLVHSIITMNQFPS